MVARVFNQVIKSRVTKNLLKAGVSIALLAYLAFILDWKKLATLDGNIFFILAAGCCIFFSALMIMSLRWKLILNYQSVPASYLTLLKFYTIAQFFNIFMPAAVGGDAIRIASSNKAYKLGWKHATAVVISERLFGLAALVFMASISFAINKELLARFSLGQAFSAGLVLSAVVMFFVARHLAARKVRMSYGLALVLLLLSAAAQFTDVAIAFLLVKYFSLDMGLADIALVIYAVYLVTMIPVSIGGLGVREGSMVALLALYQVEASTAIIMSLSLYITKLCIGLAGYIAYLQSGKADIDRNEINSLH